MRNLWNDISKNENAIINMAIINIINGEGNFRRKCETTRFRWYHSSQKERTSISSTLEINNCQNTRQLFPQTNVVHTHISCVLTLPFYSHVYIVSGYSDCLLYSYSQAQNMCKSPEQQSLSLINFVVRLQHKRHEHIHILFSVCILSTHTDIFFTFSTVRDMFIPNFAELCMNEDKKNGKQRKYTAIHSFSNQKNINNKKHK